MSGKALGFGANFERFGNAGVEVGRLFPYPLGYTSVRLGGVHEIKSKNVFLAVGTDMKAITVIGGIWKVMAVAKGLP